ncbi:MAG: Bax inhibitor-1/YccA family protein [Bifidobacteriaceae bacterium]|jgi:uncharacterized YccA/Bax inhibitor family protein|nr:Bax inhibitor-1/YccA family protein [Bifidobacteriaceae bacterium]
MSNPAFSRSNAFNGKLQTAATPYPQTGPYGGQPQTGGYPPAGPHAQNGAYGATYSPEQLSAMYSAPAASPVDTGRMTYDDVLIKSVGMLAVLLVGATVGWLFTPAMPYLYWGSFALGTVFFLINLFKSKPSPVMVTLYAVVEGIFVGGVSMIFNAAWSGIVTQAVLATLAVFAITLALFASGKVRASAKANRIVLIGLIAYLFYAVINTVLVLSGASQSMFGMSTDVTIAGFPLGLIIGPIVILLGAYCLVTSFDSIKRGVESGAPAEYAWTAAFGLLVDIVYIYIQILRVLAILRR